MSTIARPPSAASIDSAPTFLPGGNTRSTVYVPPHPPYAVRGEGFLLTDTDGHQVIDANNNYTALIHGHCHPEVVAAAQRAVGTLAAVGLPTTSEVDLAAHLASRFEGMQQWRFANSGSEAVALALRIARAATGRNLVLRFAGSYHGSSDQVCDPQDLGVGAGASQDTLALPLEDGEALAAAFAEHGSSVAAVLVDLMPNRAGMRPRSPEFVAQLNRLTQAHGALLVVDEVMTARLGVGGLQASYDIDPHLTAVGKIIGGGLPVGGVGGRREVMAAIDPTTTAHVSWGGTFNANPVTMAAGLTAMEHFTADQVDRLNALGDQLRERLATSGFRTAGRGSLMRVLATEPVQAWWAAYRAGVLLGTNGLLCLSTPMTDETVETIAERLESVQDAFAAGADR